MRRCWERSCSAGQSTSYLPRVSTDHDHQGSKHLSQGGLTGTGGGGLASPTPTVTGPGEWDPRCATSATSTSATSPTGGMYGGPNSQRGSELAAGQTVEV